jgi:pimeloyl-ACP methyl ester carboxylesterase
VPILNTKAVGLYYEVSGSGAPVLLIQGVGVVGRGWLPQVKELSEKFQVITFDNRGIGQSVNRNADLTIECMVADTLNLLDHLKLKSAHIVGHSMGGTIAQKLAIDHPEKVKSLSLLCTFSRGRQAIQLNSRIFWLGIRTRVGTKKMRRKAFLEILYSKRFLAEVTSFDELSLQTGKMVGRDLADAPPIIMRQLKALSQHDSLADLSKLSGFPTLVVSSQEDPIAQPKFGLDLASRIPGAKYIEIENASHGIVLERPNEMNKILSDFMIGINV